MAKTESTMLALGTQAPEFILNDTVSGKSLSFSELRSDVATVIMFICNHCPYVIHVNEQLVQLANDYTPKGISFIAISSNDVENYPQDAPEKMTLLAEKMAYPFPYLYDETQEVARAYHAACTPDFYVFDDESSLVYRGQLDDSRPGNGKEVTGHDIRVSLEALLNGIEAKAPQKPSMGCNIKWKTP